MKMTRGLTGRAQDLKVVHALCWCQAVVSLPGESRYAATCKKAKV